MVGLQLGRKINTEFSETALIACCITRSAHDNYLTWSILITSPSLFRCIFRMPNIACSRHQGRPSVIKV